MSNIFLGLSREQARIDVALSRAHNISSGPLEAQHLLALQLKAADLEDRAYERIAQKLSGEA